MQNSEIFTLTYGALVRQLLGDYDDLEDVHKQLDNMYVMSQGHTKPKNLIDWKSSDMPKEWIAAGIFLIQLVVPTRKTMQNAISLQYVQRNSSCC